MRAYEVGSGNIVHDGGLGSTKRPSVAKDGSRFPATDGEGRQVNESNSRIGAADLVARVTDRAAGSTSAVVPSGIARAVERR